MKNFKKPFVIFLIFLLSVTSILFLFAPTVKAETWTDITLPYTITQSGNYKITAPWGGSGTGLSINASNVVVDGQNNLLNLTRAQEDYAVAIAPNCTNVLLENINETRANVGFFVIQTNNFTIQNSVFTNNSDSGALLDSVNRFNVKNCNISDNVGDGLMIFGSTNFVVAGCNLNYNHYGSVMTFSGNATVENSTFNNCVDYGLESIYGNLTLSNSSLNNNGYSGLLCGDSDTAIYNSTFNDNYHGRYLGDGGIEAYESNITIQDSTLENSPFGILAEVCNITVTRCSITNNTVGIESDSGNNFNVQDCNIYNNSLYGIAFIFEENATVTNNRFSYNGANPYPDMPSWISSALVVEDSNSTITKNVFENNNNGFLYGSEINEQVNSTQLVDNNLFQNNNYTLFLYYATPNVGGQHLCFYNNFVNDSSYVNPFSFTSVENSDFDWVGGVAPSSNMVYLNTTVQLGERAFSNGRMIGGNYWAHPNGTGPSQTAIDANHDGFADAAFDLFGNGTIYDYLPYSSSYVSNLTITAGTSQTLVANQTSSKMTVQMVDYFGSVTSGITVNLSSNSSSGKFYSNEAGSQEVSSITIPAGSSTGNFYFKDTAAGTPTITASAQTVTPSTCNFTINPHSDTVDHISINPVAATITAGSTINYTTTAYDQYGNSWNVTASYSVDDTEVSGNTLGTNAPGIYAVTAVYGDKTTSTTLAVTTGALDHFQVLVPGTATVGKPFNIMVTAVDNVGNIVTTFTGTVSLSVGAGTVLPAKSSSFSEGVWIGAVTIIDTGSNVISVNDGSGHNGTSVAVNVNAAAATPTQNSTSTIQATVLGGANVTLILNGNVSAAQILGGVLIAHSDYNRTDITFAVTGSNGTVGFSNMTIPKSALQEGTVPAVFIDGREADSWGYCQDAQNFYVWYTTHFSTHQVQIMWLLAPQPHSTPQTPALWYALVVVVVAIAIAAVAVLMIQRKRTATKPTPQ